MTDIRYTLVSDGSSDRILIPILNWLLEGLCEDSAVQPQWADLGWLKKPPVGLAERLKERGSILPLQFPVHSSRCGIPEPRGAKERNSGGT